jgi:hypothetical protein
MLKIAPCIFHRNKLDRQADPAVTLQPCGRTGQTD